MDNLGSRLKRARENAGLTQAELAERVGMAGQQSIEAIEVGRSKNPTKIYEIAKACGVTVEWLQGKEEGAPLKIRQKFSSISPEKKPAREFVPEFDIRAGASYSGGRNDRAWNDETGWEADEPIEKWGLPAAYIERELGLSYQLTGILPIRGDSMEDGTAHSLFSGDRVIIDQKDTDVRQGGIFAVFDGDGVIIKQVELIRNRDRAQIVCKSLNRRYDNIILDFQLPVRVIGRVAGVIQKR